MSRNLLSEYSTIKAFTNIGTFDTADTMSIAVYKDGSSTAETLTTGTVSQIGTLGIFFWSFSDLATEPSALSQYVVVFSDTTTKVESFVFDFGGWVESVEPLGDADTCKISVNLSDGNGSCAIEPNDLYDKTVTNSLTIKSTIYASSRYFKLGEYKPSYSELTNEAYWTLPQGAIISVKLDTFGINEATVTVPDTTTADLYDILNP